MEHGRSKRSRTKIAAWLGKCKYCFGAEKSIENKEELPRHKITSQQRNFVISQHPKFIQSTPVYDALNRKLFSRVLLRLSLPHLADTICPVRSDLGSTSPIVNP